MKKSRGTKLGRPLKSRLAFHFLKALKKVKVKCNVNPSSMANKGKSRYHAIRGAAYASMASAIGPHKAWSRAILRRSSHHHLHVPALNKSSSGNPRNGVLMLGLGEELKNLSEMVPGGEAMDSSKLLDESTHYIKCLTAQVEIMRSILLLFSSTS